MLLWLVIALSFFICVTAWHFCQGITWGEALALLLNSGITFIILLNLTYKNATKDSYFQSGYVTSIIHRYPFSYRQGRHTHHEPERWILVQQSHPPRQIQTITRPIHSGDGIEKCHGECTLTSEDIGTSESYSRIQKDTFSIEVDAEKFKRTQPGNTSVVPRDYFNPIQASEEVIYSNVSEIPYFGLSDYNRAYRLIAAKATTAQQVKLEGINSEFSPRKISIGLIATQDNLYFEKLKRAWRNGKANDFVIVIYSPDEQTIQNVNILTWNNYVLKEKMVSAIGALHSLDIDSILDTIRTTLQNAPAFTPMNFSKYGFLQVKIPESSYRSILRSEAAVIAYMLLLMKLNPNTKTRKLTAAEIFFTWDKHHPPFPLRWYLHPLASSGVFFYIIVPIFITMLFA